MSLRRWFSSSLRRLTLPPLQGRAHASDPAVPSASADPAVAPAAPQALIMRGSSTPPDTAAQCRVPDVSADPAAVALRFDGVPRPLIIVNAPEVIAGIAAVTQGWPWHQEFAGPEDFAQKSGRVERDAEGFSVASAFVGHRSGGFNLPAPSALPWPIWPRPAQRLIGCRPSACRGGREGGPSHGIRRAISAGKSTPGGKTGGRAGSADLLR